MRMIYIYIYSMIYDGFVSVLSFNPSFNHTNGEAWHFTVAAASTEVYLLQISPSIKIASTAGELPHYSFQLSVETTFQDPQRDE